MNKISLIVFALFIVFNVYSQSPEQLSRVRKETNSDKLQADANKYRQQSEEQKAIAVQAALQNGWPITIETDSSFAEIQHLNEFGRPMYYITNNVNAAATTSTNKLYSGGGLGLSLDGEDYLIGIWDGGGVQIEHNEFNNTGSPRVTQKDTPDSYNYHATHVAGTLIGNSYNIARGMAYMAELNAYDWNSDVAEMASEANDGLLISNHSYGYVIGLEWIWNWYGGQVQLNIILDIIILTSAMGSIFCRCSILFNCKIGRK